MTSSNKRFCVNTTYTINQHKLKKKPKMMSLMAACEKNKTSETVENDIEAPMIMKNISIMNTSRDTVDSTARPSFERATSMERQNSMEKLQFNAKKAIVAGMLDITLVNF